MGYSCPVCGDPQADDVHLANHLAFTALVRGGDHEDWLDERVPDWGQLDDDGLAELVTEHAERTEYPQVFEDTTEGRDHPHDSGDGAGSGLPSGANAIPDGDLDDEARDVLREARELTRERRGTERDPDGPDGDE